MKYFIPIDRKTFRKNPRYVEPDERKPVEEITVVRVTTYHPFGAARFVGDNDVRYDNDSAEGTFLLKGLSIYVPGATCPFTADDVGQLAHRFFRAGTVDSVTTEIFLDKRLTAYYEDDKWFFDYKHKRVKCHQCLSTFISEHLDYGECPVCRAGDCCEIEYEDPEAVAKELGLE